MSVQYSTLNSTASAGTVCGNGADYVPASGTLNFAPGETTKVVRVQIVDCDPVEPFEAFTFNLDTEHNGVISRASSRVSIVDNDTIVATPKLFVRDAVVDEKDGNALVSVLAGRSRGPVLEQHRHRPLRDCERDGDRVRLHGRIRDAFLRAG